MVDGELVAGAVALPAQRITLSTAEPPPAPAASEKMAAESGIQLLVWRNQECIDLGINPFEHGSALHTDMWKTEGLKQALDIEAAMASRG